MLEAAFTVTPSTALKAVAPNSEAISGCMRGWSSGPLPFFLQWLSSYQLSRFSEKSWTTVYQLIAIKEEALKYTVMIKFLQTDLNPTIILVCCLIMEYLCMKKLLTSTSLITNKTHNSVYNTEIYRRDFQVSKVVSQVTGSNISL